MGFEAELQNKNKKIQVVLSKKVGERGYKRNYVIRSHDFLDFSLFFIGFVLNLDYLASFC